MLNNRWIVFGLVGVALLMVISNVARPLLEARKDQRPVFESPEIDVENELIGSGIETLAQDEQFSSAQAAIQKIDSAALHWDERPQRDPFRPVAEVSDAAFDVVAAVVANARPSNGSIRWPVVSAVIDSRQFQYAVVDGQIRKPGDQFAGFELNAIEQHTVELAHAASRRVRRVKVVTK